MFGNRKEMVMAPIEETLTYPEYYVNPTCEHTHIIHRTLKERIEVLEEEVEALRDQLSLILHLEPIVSSLAEEIKAKGPTPIETEESKKFLEDKDE